MVVVWQLKDIKFTLWAMIGHTCGGGAVNLYTFIVFDGM
jgi:hypothetical protein